MDAGVETGQEIQAEQAIDRTFRGELMARDGDRSKRALKEMDLRNDNERDQFLATRGECFSKRRGASRMAADSESGFSRGNHRGGGAGVKRKTYQAAAREPLNFT